MEGREAISFRRVIGLHLHEEVVAKKLFVFLLLGFVLLALVGCWWFVGRSSSDEADGYTLAPVEQGRAAEIISATGVIQPRDVYAVGAEMSGKVVEVRADFNQEVAEGDLLARLDDGPVRERLKQAELGAQEAQAGLRQAEAARDAAAAALRREQERSSEVRLQIDVDVLQHQLKSAQAAVDLQKVKVQEAEAAALHAEEDLRKTEVRAPILATDDTISPSRPSDRAGLGALAPAGAASPGKHTFTILDRLVSVNQIVAPPAAGRLFTLAAGLDRMRIEVQVAEGDVDRIARGQMAEVKGPGADEGPTFPGQVEDMHLTPISEHGAVFYKAVVEVQNQRDPVTRDWRLRPGMTADVDVLVRVHEPVWKMPAAALTFQVEQAIQSEAARAKLARQQTVKNHEWWRPVWILGAGGKPWPIFVRTGGRDARGDLGVQTAEFSEVLEWDPEIELPDPANHAAYPKFIIAAPPAKRSLFTLPKVKL